MIARHARPDTTTAVDGVLASKVDRPDPVAPSMTGTVLALIAQGAKRLALGDRVYEYGAGQYLVASVDLPVTGQFVSATREHPALGFGLVWSCAPRSSPNCSSRPAPATSRPPPAPRPRASPSTTRPTS